MNTFIQLPFVLDGVLVKLRQIKCVFETICAQLRKRCIYKCLNPLKVHLLPFAQLIVDFDDFGVHRHIIFFFLNYLHILF